MANPHDGSLSPPSDNPIVPITPAEYPAYYFRRNGRLFPTHRLPLHLRDNHDAVQLPCVLPVDPQDMEVRVMTIIDPLTLIYRVLL